MQKVAGRKAGIARRLSVICTAVIARKLKISISFQPHRIRCVSKISVIPHLLLIAVISDLELKLAKLKDVVESIKERIRKLVR